jgi:hypothetical protein
MNGDREKAPFLTGSHAYGTPGAGSDVDVVMYGGTLPGGLITLLNEHADKHAGAGYKLNDGGDSIDLSLTFGKLNLIIMSDAAKFEAWRKATAFLQSESRQSPISREYAVETIERFEATENNNPKKES